MIKLFLFVCALIICYYGFQYLKESNNMVSFTKESVKAGVYIAKKAKTDADTIYKKVSKELAKNDTAKGKN